MQAVIQVFVNIRGPLESSSSQHSVAYCHVVGVADIEEH